MHFIWLHITYCYLSIGHTLPFLNIFEMFPVQFLVMCYIYFSKFVNTWFAIFSGVSERVADIKTRIFAMKCLTAFCEAVGPGFVFDRVRDTVALLLFFVQKVLHICLINPIRWCYMLVFNKFSVCTVKHLFNIILCFRCTLLIWCLTTTIITRNYLCSFTK